MKTLIQIDIQNDFMPDGPLAIEQGDTIVPVINQISDRFDLIVATQDWHPQNHNCFASNHRGKRPFEEIQLHGLKQTLWPDHCVQGTKGAEFHPQLNTKSVSAIFRKGMNAEIDSYSGFYDNGKQVSTGLAGYLREKGAEKLYFCGLAADICVYYSILDALSEGFECYLIEDAVCALDKKQFRNIRSELSAKGTFIITSKDI